MAYQNILLAVDLSNDYNTLVTKSNIITKAHNASLNIISIIPATIMLSGILASDKEAELIEEYGLRMQKIIDKLDVDVNNTKILHGSLKNDIINYIHQYKIDLIILAHHHNNPINEFLLGPTIESIFNSIPCDTIIIKDY
jgi:universal stress protein A